MKVYLTGVHTVKKPKSNSGEKIKSGFRYKKSSEKSLKKNNRENDNEDNIVIEEDFSQMDKSPSSGPSKNISNKTFQSLKKI